MDKKMQSLIDAPLADPNKVYLPEGKRRAPYSPRAKYHGDEMPKGLSRSQLAERKQKARDEKLDKLYAYYAGTDLSIERIAEHMGIYRQEQTGVDEKTGKPVFVRKLDLKEVEANIAWRRKKAAAA